MDHDFYLRLIAIFMEWNLLKFALLNFQELRSPLLLSNLF